MCFSSTSNRNKMIVEVFKTNVLKIEEARMLAQKIRKINEAYIANFDLEDCDRILRVKSTDEPVAPFIIISLLNAFGFQAEVLEDEINSGSLSKIFSDTEIIRKQKKYLNINPVDLSKVLTCEINNN
jgi:hypothetical protein